MEDVLCWTWYWTPREWDSGTQEIRGQDTARYGWRGVRAGADSAMGTNAGQPDRVAASDGSGTKQAQASQVRLGGAKGQRTQRRRRGGGEGRGEFESPSHLVSFGICDVGEVVIVGYGRYGLLCMYEGVSAVLIYCRGSWRGEWSTRDRRNPEPRIRTCAMLVNRKTVV